MKQKTSLALISLALLSVPAIAAEPSPAAPASTDLGVNPFTGTSMSYEQMLEKQRNLEMALKLKKSELDLAKTQAQIELVPYSKKQNIRELEKKDAPQPFNPASLAMPNISPMPGAGEARQAKRVRGKPASETAPAMMAMPAMVPPAPPQPKVGAVIRDGDMLSAVVTIQGESRTVKSGDQIGGYRVLSVSERQVVLQGGPMGSLFLPVDRKIGRIDYAVPIKEPEGRGAMATGAPMGAQPPTNAQLAQSLMMPPGVKPVNGPMPGI